jgi:hypothetical protein
MRDAIGHRSDRMTTATNAFAPDALDANRAGRLTDSQKSWFRGSARGYRVAELQFAGLATVIGLLVWFAPGPARDATTKPLIGIACLILAGFLVARSFIGADSVTRDLRAGRVDAAEGAITKWTISQRSGPAVHMIGVAGHKIRTARDAYDAAPDAGIVRVYFLPASHRFVNMERLPDRPLPAGAMSDPKHAAMDAFRGIRSHDATQSAEARAELAAMGNVLKAQVEGSPAGPPPASRDPRPLAEAIVGTWHNPMITLAFSADGSLTITSLGGLSRAGRWSTDAAGKLVSDGLGDRQAADAWVAGDELTISMGGQAMKFEKAAT